MPRLTDTQVSVASERAELARNAEEIQRRKYLDVARATGIPSHQVEEVVRTYNERFGREPEPEPVKTRPTPTIPTEQMKASRIQTIELHLLAIPALTRLLDPETATRASAALQATKEALSRWEEVRDAPATSTLDG